MLKGRIIIDNLNNEKSISPNNLEARSSNRSRSNSSSEESRSPGSSWRRDRSQSPTNNSNADSSRKYEHVTEDREKDINDSQSEELQRKDNNKYVKRFEKNVDRENRSRSYSPDLNDVKVKRDSSSERNRQLSKNRYHDETISKSKKIEESHFDRDEDRYNKYKSNYSRRHERSRSRSRSRTRTNSRYVREYYRRSNSPCTRSRSPSYKKRSPSPYEHRKRNPYYRRDSRSPHRNSFKNSRGFSSNDSYKNSRYQLSKERSRSPDSKRPRNSHYLRSNYKHEEHRDSEKYTKMYHKPPAKRTYEHNQFQKWNYPSNFENAYQSFDYGYPQGDNFWITSPPSGYMPRGAMPQCMPVPPGLMHHSSYVFPQSFMPMLPPPMRHHFMPRFQNTYNRPPRTGSLAPANNIKVKVNEIVQSKTANESTSEVLPNAVGENSQIETQNKKASEKTEKD